MDMYDVFIDQNIKMLILPQIYLQIYGFSAIPIKFQTGILVVLYKLIQKFIWR